MNLRLPMAETFTIEAERKLLDGDHGRSFGTQATTALAADLTLTYWTGNIHRRSRLRRT